MEGICKKCGKKYEEEIKKPIPEKQRVALRLLTESTPEDNLKELERIIIETYEELRGLCDACKEELIRSDPKLSKEISDRTLEPLIPLDELFEYMLVESARLDLKAWAIAEKLAKKQKTTPEALLKELSKEVIAEKQKEEGNIMSIMPKATIFENGKPVATSDKEEAERLTGRIAIIDKVLKEMGFSEGYAKYNEYIQEMTSKDFEKYKEFTDRVDKLVKEQDA